MKTITLTKEGERLTFDKSMKYVISTLKNGKYRIEIKRYTEKRTLDQNALMWLWLECIYRETGTMKEDAYAYYCKKFLSRIVIIKGKEESINDTSSMLDTKRMSEFMTNMQADASAELGIRLPLPEDRYYEDFINEYYER